MTFHSCAELRQRALYPPYGAVIGCRLGQGRGVTLDEEGLLRQWQEGEPQRPAVNHQRGE